MMSAERKVLAKRIEAAMRIRNHADDEAALLQLGHHRRHVVVHLEVVIHRPLIVNVARDLDHLWRHGRPCAR